MHISQLLHALLRRPNIEIVKSRLPERPLRLVLEQIPLSRITPLSLRQKRLCAALFQNLHRRRWTAHLRLSNQKMNVLRHDHIADHHEAITLACLFQNVHEPVATARRVQQGQSPVARASNKVQVVRPISAMQAGRHKSLWYRRHRTRPCKKPRAGHPRSRNGKGIRVSKGELPDPLRCVIPNARAFTGRRRDLARAATGLGY